METLQVLSHLGQDMSFEQEGEPCAPAENKSAVCGSSHSPLEDIPIYMATLPNGKRMPVLKTMLSTVCEKNCNYCGFRSGRDCQRYSLTPDQLAASFIQLSNKGVVQGIMLSSGVAGGGIRTQDRLIATAEVLRQKYRYLGYIHLKMMPGSEKAQVERSMQLANRVSVNLEAPTIAWLSKLAPEKNFLDELIKPLTWVEEIRKTGMPRKGWNRRWPSSVTQFVVGATDENDQELLTMTDYLHNQLHLKRVYFSGFNPILDTPLENRTPLNDWRSYRLYQAAFLLRDYPFKIADLVFSKTNNLALEVDPKIAWAEVHLKDNPLEINQVDLEDLMRIPGIGREGAQKIITQRRKNRFLRFEELKSIGIHTRRAAPYILINGHSPARQLNLW